MDKTSTPHWGSLGLIEQIILRESADDVTFVDVLNAVTGPTEDGPYWNRKFKYVPSVQLATAKLIGNSLIVIRRRDRVGGFETLSQPEALEVAGDAGSWWRYESTDSLDAQETATDDHPFVENWIDATDTGLLVLRGRPSYVSKRGVEIFNLGSTGDVDVDRDFRFPDTTNELLE
ncbi:hypothetical protein [Subtercola sp. RTI3]|uniref:hypothetical protein n=1 Tax=Subtercola sp. RTI3 TaxID=3048639 RepID=UPI002B233441|nr:hypothetical protein [Subtercola sp. RTI3]MEA9984124.1 hypothetical protein [Subtercola sp. RTI3]